MRDPARIDLMLQLLEKIWKKAPDLRFFQLVYILQTGFSKQHHDAGKIIEIEADGFLRVGFDFFNVEDDAFLEYLRAIEKNGL